MVFVNNVFVDLNIWLRKDYAGYCHDTFFVQYNTIVSVLFGANAENKNVVIQLYYSINFKKKLCINLQKNALKLLPVFFYVFFNQVSLPHLNYVCLDVCVFAGISGSSAYNLSL